MTDKVSCGRRCFQDVFLCHLIKELVIVSVARPLLILVVLSAIKILPGRTLELFDNCKL
jgi:hypothetical protein